MNASELRSIDSHDDLIELARVLPEELGVPGVALGFQRGDGPAWLAAHGLADVEAGREMEETTPCRIASISKTFTATAVVRLSLKGRFGLDDPMVTYLPELRRVQTNGRPIESLLVRHFLTHRSGIVGEPPTRRWFESPFPTIEEVLERSELIEVVRAPGAVEKYSNLGYALLGELVARTAGSSCEQHVHDSLTEPAGMSSTGFEPPAGHAVGYRRRSAEGWSPCPPQEFNAERPGAGVWSSAPDLLTWAIVSQGLREDVLPTSMADRLLRAEIVRDADFTIGRTLAWELTRPAARLIHHHEGGVEGFCSSLAFCRAERAAAVILTNGHCELTAKISHEMLGVTMPTPPSPARTIDAASADGPVGHYLGLLECSAWIVTGEDGELKISGSQFSNGIESATRLDPAGEDRFTVTAGRWIGELLELQRDSTGAVTGFMVAGFEHTRAES